MRLDKFLAGQGLGTRTGVRAIVRAGRVCVDGNIVLDAGFGLDASHASVTVDGQPQVYSAVLHIMLNKPCGVLTAADDARHQTVMDLLPRMVAARGCMPMGRLDLDTEGLLLFTTDGHLAHRLLSPKRHVDKRYYVEVDMPLTQSDADAFGEGLRLSDFTALPALLEIEGDARHAYVTLREGKFHQVKRMFLARGKEVTHLKRVSFGGVVLDESLAPGEWRELTCAEAALLTKAAEGEDHA